MQPIPLSELDTRISARIAAGQLTVPVLPTVASEVLGLVADPLARLDTLVGSIHADPALAGHVIKYANSPLVRSGAAIVSLDQAIMRLGMRAVGNVAMAACMGPRLFRAPLYAGLIDESWEESRATAIWAREIARECREDADSAFLRGLLHQVGRPVVLQMVQEALGASPQDAPGAELVRELLDRHAAAAGLGVAQRWNLPEAITETIRCIEQQPQSRGVALVAAARVFSRAMLRDSDPEPGPLALAEPV
ncbi:MAG: HDOD domain-containing protein, partial [Gammaproteobacteria bacterium]